MESTNKKTILIVEDDAVLLEMYQIKFQNEGFTVEIAADGEAGLAKAQTAHPDIILLDVNLPKMDGFSVLKAIKANTALQSIPVILLTNLGQEQNVQEGLSMGAADYFVKANLTPGEVVEKVKTLLT